MEDGENEAEVAKEIILRKLITVPIYIVCKEPLHLNKSQ